MNALDFTTFDLDFPAGSKNKTATLITGENDAVLVDAGFTRADGHRLTAAVLDSGKTLTTVFISYGDPDFYFGAEVLADSFPQARFVATPLVIEHIRHSYEGKLTAWAALDPQLVVPGHRLPDTPADASAIAATREYLLAFEEEFADAADGAALTDALTKRYPENGMLIAAQIGAKVVTGEMSWG